MNCLLSIDKQLDMSKTASQNWDYMQKKPLNSLIEAEWLLMWINTNMVFNKRTLLNTRSLGMV